MVKQMHGQMALLRNEQGQRVAVSSLFGQHCTVLLL